MSNFLSRLSSRRFLLAVLGVIIVAGSQWLGLDEATVEDIGLKVIALVGMFTASETVLDMKRASAPKQEE